MQHTPYERHVQCCREVKGQRLSQWVLPGLLCLTLGTSGSSESPCTHVLRKLVAAEGLQGVSQAGAPSRLSRNWPEKW